MRNIEYYNNLFKSLTLKNGKGLNVLRYIQSHPNCSVGEICDNLKIDQVTVSILLRKLKEHGFVESKISKANRLYIIKDEKVENIINEINLDIEDE